MWNPRRTLQIPTKILFIAPKDSFCLPVNWSNKSNEEWRILSFMYVGSFNFVLKWSNSYLFGSGKCSHWSFIAWITVFFLFFCFTQACILIYQRTKTHDTFFFTDIQHNRHCRWRRKLRVCNEMSSFIFCFSS